MESKLEENIRDLILLHEENSAPIYLLIHPEDYMDLILPMKDITNSFHIYMGLEIIRTEDVKKGKPIVS